MLAHLRGPDYTSFKEEYTRFLDTSGAGARTHADDEHPRAKLVAHVLPSEIWAHYGAVCAYESLLPGAPVASLHALRIEGKRLRYLLDRCGTGADRRTVTATSVASRIEAATTDEIFAFIDNELGRRSG